MKRAPITITADPDCATFDTYSEERRLKLIRANCRRFGIKTDPGYILSACSSAATSGEPVTIELTLAGGKKWDKPMDKPAFP